MIFRLLLLFIVVPIVELAILHYVAVVTSLRFTIAVILVTGIVGTWLAKWQGLRTWRAIQGELASGRLPKQSLLDGVMILVAGALLVTPGMLTDVFGLSLLVPFCRRYYRAWLIRWFRARFRIERFSTGRESRDASSDIIDSYVVRPPEEQDERTRRMTDD